MLRLMESRDEVSVVDDQVGSPTYAGNIADAIICIAERVLEGKQCWGTYHYVDADVMSWHKFSELIFQQAMSLGMIEKKMKVNAIPSIAYPTPTKRPSYSVLDTSSLVREFSFNQVNCLSSLDTVLKALGSGKAID